MTEKELNNWTILLLGSIVVSFLIGFWLGKTLPHFVKIHNPYIIYNDGRIEKLDTKEIYAIVSEKDLKYFTEKPPFTEEELK